MGSAESSHTSLPGHMPGRLPILLCHGGAWAIPEALWQRSREGVARAATLGFDELTRGNTAVDAVVRAVNVLEDDPVFDAGTGWVVWSCVVLYEMNISNLCCRRQVTRARRGGGILHV